MLSLKTILRVCSSAMTRARPVVRLFAGTNKQVARTQAKAPDNLAKTLENELQFEKQRYAEFQEGQEFLKETGFTLINSPETVEIKLIKNVGDKTVEIRYQAGEPIKDEEEPGTEEEKKQDKGQEGDEEGKDNIKTATDFSVVIKNKDGSGLLFDCTSQDTELSIYHVAYNKNIDQLLKPNPEKENPAYIGPTFENLDEKVQQSFVEYLESLGISDKLLAFIECSSIDKEQKMYINWLNEVKEFVEPGKQ